MRRPLASVVYTCLLPLVLPALNAFGQTHAKEAARERRAIVTEAQQRYAERKQEEKEPGVIRLGENGPLEDVFQEFDIPFAVMYWYCTPSMASAAESPRQQSLSKKDRADCQKNLQTELDRKTEVTFRYQATVTNTAKTAPRIRVRIMGAPADKEWSTGVTLGTSSPPETAEKKILLSDLLAYGVRGRVDILLYTEKDGQFVPQTGMSLTFENIPELLAASYTTVSRATAAARQKAAATRASASTGTKTACPAEPYEHRVNVRLDRTGVATSEFLNPRWPVLIGPNPGETCDTAPEAFQKHAVLVFINRVADRQFVVTFSGIGEDNRWAFMNAGLRLSNCSGDECDAVILVPPGGQGEVRVPVELLYNAYAKDKKRVPVLGFAVALFDEEAQLANPSGFFSLVPYQQIEEQGDASKWSATVTGQFGYTPDLGDLAPPGGDPMISDTQSRGGANEWRFSGTARVSLMQRLGSRARGEFDLRLKGGGFGEGGAPTVSATKYKLNVFAIQGMTFTGGRFDVTAPSESISLAEGGENIGMHFRFVDVSHIFKKNVPEIRRDVLAFEDEPSARDHSATVVQFRGIPALTWKRAKLDFYGLYGRKKETRCVLSVDVKCPAAPKEKKNENGDVVTPPPPDVFELAQRYATFGSELSFGFLNGFGGTAAIYTSQLWTPDQPPATEQILTDRGRGTVGLFTLAWTKFDDANALDTRPVDFTLRGQYGIGTGDDPTKNDSENDGYLGETAGFAPDVLFLGLLAPAIQTSRGQVGAGLTNKQYSGLLFTTPRWSLLKTLAEWMKVPDVDVSSASTTVKAHVYRFREAVGGKKYAGSEIDAEFAVESPAGLNYSLSIAGFWPGESLKRAVDKMAPERPGVANTLGPLIRTFQWTVVAGITVKL